MTMNPDTTNGGHSAPIEFMLPEMREEFERGLRFTHVMLDVNQRQGRASVAMVQALANVLLQKGLIQEEELKAALAQAEKEVTAARQPRVRLGNMGDKYTDNEAVEIDCASLLHLCQARCCTFKFYLTKQDLDEGVAKWDYGNPYWIRQGEDGYCVHWDRGNGGCTIHAQRPHVCRKYDCRNDKRVWLDFEQRIPAPMPELAGEAPIAMLELAVREWLQQQTEDGQETTDGETDG